jgi:predicted phosphodiesterase
VKRIGVISDPHGNLLALDAVLAELEREELDGLVCLGDIAVGPQPAETLARVMALDCPIVKGNWETWFCEGIPPAEDEIAQKLLEIGEFWVAQLSADELAVMRSLPTTVELDLGDGLGALCFHGSPSSNEEGIYSITPDETLEQILGDAVTPVMLCGHTHIQMLRRLEHALVVNPGAIGLPFSEWAPHTIAIAPWAEYGILTHDDGRLHVDLRRTTYDVASLLRMSRESGMPHAEWWADCWQLDLLRSG